MSFTDDVLAVAIPQLQRDEGFRSNAYPDPLSGGDPWTVGYGATGLNVTEGSVWTEPEAIADLQARCQMLCVDLNADLPWWTNLDPVRGAVLVNMAYNMGIKGLLGFPRTLAAVQASDYAAAGADMMQSRWATQVPERAQRLATQMETGVAQ